MQRPAFKWEWNINTIAVLLGFAAGLITWGYTLAGLSAGINEVERLAKRISVVELEIRKIENHELRVSNLEKHAVDATSALRSLEGTLNGLASDMKVTREILQRLEASQRRRDNLQP